MRRYLPKNTEELLRWYERYISPLSLVAGFLSDNLFLLKRVDLFRTNALLFAYLVISAVGIVLINAIEAGRLKHRLALKAAPFIPVVVQFCFGGLFSGYLSLYSRSASFAFSWIFVVALALLLLGNERFTRHYSRFSFQVSVYFFVLLSFLEFFLPVVFHRIGPSMFIGSSMLSLALIALFIFALARIAPRAFRQYGTRSIIGVGVIFVLFNLFYFTNVIPPLPLSLKEAGVYHSVMRLPGGGYQLSGEQLPWYEAYLNYPSTFHKTPNEAVFVFTSVFAPSGLSVEILHQWQFYDSASKEWQTRSTISFPIYGGADLGYRGYSESLDPQAGQWRVNVVTQYGQLIGRVSFTVVNVTAGVPLVQSTDLP